jgi:hypothetical protein
MRLFPIYIQRSLTSTLKSNKHPLKPGSSHDLTFSGPHAIGSYTPQVEGTDVGVSQSVTFTNGVTDGTNLTLVAYKAESVTVNVGDGTINSTGHGLALTVNPGPIDHFGLNDVIEINAGTRAAYTVTRYDQFNNLVTSGAQTVYLYTSSTGVNAKFYDAASDGSVITSVIIADTTSSADFWYFDGKAGTWVITASDHTPLDDPDIDIINATDSLVVNPADTTTTAKVSASAVRFKDLITLSATVVGNSPADDPLTGSVEFSIGGISYGSVEIVYNYDKDDGSYLATLITQVTNYLPSLPHDYAVTAVFTSTNPNYAGSSGTTSLHVDPREASTYGAGYNFYTGTKWAWTTGPNSSTGTVTLMATIKDATLPEGDVRAATVTFLLNDQPIGSAKNLPVNLVDITDGTVGTASAVVQLNIGKENSESYEITVVVGGAYYNDPTEPESQELIVVSKPITGGEFKGSGQISNEGSAGFIKGASGEVNDTTFYFDVAYNKKGTNPQGKVTIWVWSWYKPDGTLDTTTHKYVITSNAIATLAINQKGALGTASFSSKATVKEELSGGGMSGIDGGAVIQISVTDQDTTGDLLAITVQQKKGGLWFSSNWSGTNTVEKAVSDGNIDFSVTP